MFLKNFFFKNKIKKEISKNFIIYKKFCKFFHLLKIYFHYNQLIFFHLKLYLKDQ